MTTLSRPIRHICHLPPELVHYALNFLPIVDLRQAAHVSQHFCVIAQRVAGYSVALRFNRPQRMLGARDALADVIVQRLPISLTLNLSAVASHIVVQDCSMLPDAFPYLVELRLVVSAAHRRTLDPVLCVPAPRLRFFSIRHQHERYAVPSMVALPVDVFGGTAPMLRSLTLVDVPFGEPPSAAFKSIRTLELYYSCGTPDVKLVQHVPSVRQLLIHFVTFDSQHGIQPFRLQCPGLDLTRLEVHDSMILPVFGRICLDLLMSKIPLVVHIPHETITPLFWQGLEEPLSLRIGRRKRAYVVSLRAQDTGIHRVLLYPKNAPVSTSITNRFKIRDIRLDLVNVYGLIYASTACGLPALQLLQIDAVPPHVGTAEHLNQGARRSSQAALPSVICPQLDVVRVYAARPDSTLPAAKEALRTAEVFVRADHFRPCLEVIGFEDVDLESISLEKRFTEVRVGEANIDHDPEWEDIDYYI